MANGRNPIRGRSRKTVFFQSQAFAVSMESNIVENLKKLEQEAATKVLRSMTYAATRVMYDGMRRNVPVKDGTLYGSIYHWYDTKQSTPTHITYWVGPNKSKAPHWYNVEHGHWRYNKIVDGRFMRSKSNPNARVRPPGGAHESVHNLAGALASPVWVPAKPYIRVTWDQGQGAARQAAIARARERMREVLADAP